MYIGNKPQDLNYVYLGPSSLRNRIINGNFDIWQRGTSLSAASSLRYLADRAFTFAAGSTVAPSRQSFALGQTDVPFEPTYFHRCVVSSVAGAGNFGFLGHRIESVRTFANQSAVLSFWAKADASKNMAIEFNQYFGSGGSPSSQVNFNGSITTLPLTTTWQLFTIVVTPPSIAGKSLGTNGDDYLQVSFWFDAGSNYNSRTNSLGQQSGTFDIAQVQFEPGVVRTPFEQRPIGLEKYLASRYFQKIVGGSIVNNGNCVASTSTINMKIGSILPMRAVPALTVKGPFTDANYVATTPTTQSQWNLFQHNIGFATKTGTVTATLASTATGDVNDVLLLFSGATFNLPVNGISTGGASQDWVWIDSEL